MEQCKGNAWDGTCYISLKQPLNVKCQMLANWKMYLIQNIFNLKYQYAFFGWPSFAFISFDRIACFASFKLVIIAHKQNSIKTLTVYLLSTKKHELLGNFVIDAGKCAFYKT